MQPRTSLQLIGTRTNPKLRLGKFLTDASWRNTVLAVLHPNVSFEKVRALKYPAADTAAMFSWLL